MIATTASFWIFLENFPRRFWLDLHKFPKYFLAPFMRKLRCRCARRWNAVQSMQRLFPPRLLLIFQHAKSYRKIPSNDDDHAILMFATSVGASGIRWLSAVGRTTRYFPIHSSASAFQHAICCASFSKNFRAQLQNCWLRSRVNVLAFTFKSQFMAMSIIDIQLIVNYDAIWFRPFRHDSPSRSPGEGDHRRISRMLMQRADFESAWMNFQRSHFHKYIFIKFNISFSSRSPSMFLYFVSAGFIHGALVCGGRNQPAQPGTCT